MAKQRGKLIVTSQLENHLKALRNLLNRARYLPVGTLGSQSSFSLRAHEPQGKSALRVGNLNPKP